MSRRERFLALRHSTPVILPSLLMCDFGDLRTEISKLAAAGIKSLHLDVMDGHFVPNLSYGMPIVAAIRELTDMPLDVHLMIEQPEKWIEPFYQAGADCITFHAEATANPIEVCQSIRKLGAAAGVAINPPTPLSDLEPVLDHCDLALIMSVQAGWGGQSFEPVALEKLDQLRTRAGSDVLLEVDGGVNRSTIANCSQAGAELFVVGSAIFKNADYSPVVSELSGLAGG